jgi:VanZ family protein
MKFIKSYYRTIIWAIIIAYLLFTPGNKLPKVKLFTFYGADKLIHIFIFMVFQFLLFLDGFARLQFLKVKRIINLIIITLTYATTTEVLQFFLIENRTGSIFDLIADIGGIIFAFTLFFIYWNFKDRFYRQTF